MLRVLRVVCVFPTSSRTSSRTSFKALRVRDAFYKHRLIDSAASLSLSPPLSHTQACMCARRFGTAKNSTSDEENPSHSNTPSVLCSIPVFQAWNLRSPLPNPFLLGLPFGIILRYVYRIDWRTELSRAKKPNARSLAIERHTPIFRKEIHVQSVDRTHSRNWLHIMIFCSVNKE